MNKPSRRVPWRSVFALITLSSVVGYGADSKVSTSTGQGVHPREVVLDNGLKLLLVERHEQPTVAAGVFYDVGSVNDPRGKSGIAHLFEHMLFKGSKTVGTSDYPAERSIIQQQDRLRKQMITEMNRMRDMKRRGRITDVLDPKQWTAKYTELKQQYDQLVATARQYIKNNEFANLYTTNGGARLNAGTMEDLTMYFVGLPSNKIELFFWLESDRMAGGIMREFYVERDNVREERRLRVESTPTGKFDEAFEALFWQSHPYGVPVLGWPSEVESITRDDVRDFYKVYYAPNNATVALVGDFDTEKMINLARKYFGRIPRGKKEPPPVITEESEPLAVRRIDAEAETNPRVRIRYHGVAIGHSDEAALDVLAALLSGKTGRLYKRLVSKEDVALGQPSAGHQGRKYAGYFEINVTVKEGRVPEDVETMVLEELEKLKHGAISEHELQKVKNQVLASSIRRLQSNFGLMFQLGLYETWYDWHYINESPKRMLAVTADDIRRVAGKYLDPSTRTVAIYRTKAPTPSGVTSTDRNGASAHDRAASSDDATVSVGTEQTGDDLDAEYERLVQTLPKKVRRHMERRLKQLQTLDDPEDIDYRADVLESAIASSSLSKVQMDMFIFVIKKMRERSNDLRYQHWAKEAQTPDKEQE